MKCNEFQEKLEKIRADYAYLKHTLDVFQKEGVEIDSIEWLMQKLEMSADNLRDRLTSSREDEAKEILGEDFFVGTRIAQEIFGATLDMFDNKIPFSRAELMKAKLDGKMLIYRPDYINGKITPERLLTHIGLNHPQVNMDFFKDDHQFDFAELLKMNRSHPLRNLEMEKSNWTLLKFHNEKASLPVAEAAGALPSVIEVYYDLLASKKVSKFFKDDDEYFLWTSTGIQPHETTGRYAMYGAAAANEQLRLNPKYLSSTAENQFYTCETRPTF